ncbi:hypothetical protein NEMIN01_1428 [Nematocida minor]|uniref:uncharacterized protein n=1 Tax=Nematocida minor TaxID=1912983 RepID=UPI00221F2E12|nr:uncharacterized protein NEMIN01_1428 [Nematocida minor]KAI5191220.1 hypothetical protein NEMIN01_1428 [Nematocida minor]
MQSQQKTQLKKILRFGTVVVVVVLIAILPFYCISLRNQNKAADTAEPLIDAEVEPVPITKTETKTAPAIYFLIEKKSDITKVFERENIIPVRSLRDEEKVAKKPSLFGRIKGYFTREEEKETLDITPEEMAIQLDSSRNILQNYNGNLIRRINDMRTAEKKVLILDIRMKVLELSSILPSKHTLLDDSNSLFWFTVFSSGDSVFDWMAYTLSQEELENIRNEISELFESTDSPSNVRASLFSTLKDYITRVSQEAGFGGEITKVRESLVDRLRKYKAPQDMINDSEESCQTEKLLLALDVLSYLVPMTDDSRNEIACRVNAIKDRLYNATEISEKRQMNDYLRITKKYNEDLVSLINRYMHFIADLEQYVSVCSRSTENMKNIARKNESSYVYDFATDANPTDIIKGVGNMLGLSSDIFAQYRQLLEMNDDLVTLVTVTEEVVEVPVIVDTPIAVEEVSSCSSHSH